MNTTTGPRHWPNDPNLTTAQWLHHVWRRARARLQSTNSGSAVPASLDQPRYPVVASYDQGEGIY